MHYKPKLYEDEGKPENHGKPWRSENVEILQAAFRKGLSLVGTASKLGRRVSACLIKLEACGDLERESVTGFYKVRYGYAMANWSPDAPIYNELCEVPQSLLVSRPAQITPRTYTVGTRVPQVEQKVSIEEIAKGKHWQESLKELGLSVEKLQKGLLDHLVTSVSRAQVEALTRAEALAMAKALKAGGGSCTVEEAIRANKLVLPISALESSELVAPRRVGTSLFLKYKSREDESTKESTMNLDTLKIETKTFVNGTDVDHISDNELLNLLQASKAKQSSLKAMTNELASFHANASKEQTDKLEQIINDRAEKRKQEAEKAGK